jgi:hypothetical protein
VIGLAGVLRGVVVSEYFRRKSRIENYAQEVFPIRLKVYEGLLSKIHAIRQIETEINRNEDMPLEDKASIWSEAIIDMARFFDENENRPIQIKEEIVVHVMSTLLQFHSLFETDDKNEKEKIMRKFAEDSVRAIDMIRDEAGLTRIEQHYVNLTRAKHNSEYVKLLKQVREKYSKDNT